MNLINVKNKKSEVKQVANLKQCIVHSTTHDIYSHFKLKRTVLSASEIKIKSEACIQYRCTFFLFCRELNVSLPRW